MTTKRQTGKIADENKMLAHQFGERILTALAHRSLTKATLAEKSGVSYDTMLKLVRGSRNPNLKTIARLATALDMTVSELLGTEFPP